MLAKSLQILMLMGIFFIFTIKLYYKDNENKLELFPKLQTSKLEFNLDYSKTVVKSTNLNSMKAGELLDLSIILYDKNN